MSNQSKISPVTGHYVDSRRRRPANTRSSTWRTDQGQPLVCQHTAGCHNHQWRGLLEDEEITSNYRVIAYDLPRHGKSDPPENTQWWTRGVPAVRRPLRQLHRGVLRRARAGEPDLHGLVVRRQRRTAAGAAPPRPVRWCASPSRVPTTRPGSTSTGGSTRTPTRRRCAPAGVWDLMAPQSPEADRWKTWFYYTQGSEAFKGDLYFYSVDHDLRGKLGDIDGDQCPGGDDDR